MESILDFLNGLHIITKVLIRERQKYQSQRRCDDTGRGGSDSRKEP